MRAGRRPSLPVMTSSQLTADLREVTAIAEAIAADRLGGIREDQADAELSEITHDAMTLELGTRCQAPQILNLLILASDLGWVAETPAGRWRCTAKGRSALSHGTL